MNFNVKNFRKVQPLPKINFVRRLRHIQEGYRVMVIQFYMDYMK